MDDNPRDEHGVLYRAIRCPLTESERNARALLRVMIYGGDAYGHNDMRENPCAGLHPPDGTPNMQPDCNFPPDRMRVPCHKICGKHMYAALP